MQVILLADVDNLGLRGDVVDVARGYARNFLLPRRLAEQATPARVSELEKRERLRARHEAATVEQAREIAAVLERAELRFDVKAGPTGSLFGSVTSGEGFVRVYEGSGTLLIAPIPYWRHRLYTSLTSLTHTGKSQ